VPPPGASPAGSKPPPAGAGPNGNKQPPPGAGPAGSKPPPPSSPAPPPPSSTMELSQSMPAPVTAADVDANDLAAGTAPVSSATPAAAVAPPALLRCLSAPAAASGGPRSVTTLRMQPRGRPPGVALPRSCLKGMQDAIKESLANDPSGAGITTTVTATVKDKAAGGRRLLDGGYGGYGGGGGGVEVKYVIVFVAPPGQSVNAAGQVVTSTVESVAKSVIVLEKLLRRALSPAFLAKYPALAALIESMVRGLCLGGGWVGVGVGVGRARVGLWQGLGQPCHRGGRAILTPPAPARPAPSRPRPRPTERLGHHLHRLGLAAEAPEAAPEPPQPPPAAPQPPRLAAAAAKPVRTDALPPPCSYDAAGWLQLPAAAPAAACSSACC
jgi:hypothetical protein